MCPYLTYGSLGVIQEILGDLSMIPAGDFEGRYFFNSISRNCHHLHYTIYFFVSLFFRGEGGGVFWIDLKKNYCPFLCQETIL